MGGEKRRGKCSEGAGGGRGARGTERTRLVDNTRFNGVPLAAGSRSVNPNNGGHQSERARESQVRKETRSSRRGKPNKGLQQSPVQGLQGYLAHKKTPTPLGPQALAYGRVLGGCMFLLVKNPGSST